MTAKEYLSQIDKAREKIYQRADLIEHLRCHAGSTGGPRGNGVRVMTSNPTGDRMADQVAEIVDLESELEGEIADLKKLQAEAAKKFSDMTDGELARVLYLRYIRGQSNKVIAVELNKNRSCICRMFARALEAFESQYKDDLM